MASWNPLRPPPAPPAFGAGKLMPEQNASLVFAWLSPILSVGFTRPLEADDLWSLPPERLTNAMAQKLQDNFYARCPPEKRPLYMQDSGSSSKPSVSDAKQETKVDDPKAKKQKSPYDSSLGKALHGTFSIPFWTAGVLLLIAETLRTTTPLVNQVLLNWLVKSYVYVRLTDEERQAFNLGKPQGIGYGIGLAFALFAMQESASLLTNHSYQLGMRNGLLVRTSIIGSIFRKSLRLSGRARLEHSVGQITTMISSDVEKFDLLSYLAHYTWIAPLQLIIVIGLLIKTIGVSALVGFGLLIVAAPPQAILVKIMFDQRFKGVKITDARVRLITEVLQGIRLVKFYGWEDFYVERIQEMRTREVKTIRKSAWATSALVAMFTVMPTLAMVLSLITYKLTGHALDIAKIFTAVQLYSIARIPLVLLPMVLSFLAPTLVAMRRIATFLTAEELASPYTIDEHNPDAITVDGDFTWENIQDIERPEEEEHDPARKMLKAKEKKEKERAEKERKKRQAKEAKKRQKEGEEVLPSVADDAQAKDDNPKEEPFAIKDLKLNVHRGAFVGIIGRVGSGKSSVLQALVGEMRRLRGETIFGGKVAYVPQIPWIRNETVKNNILFGEADDEDRLQEVVDTCSLRYDMDVLPHGLETEIGEKGINLSGGQKARISLARAAYSSADIVLLDDPLSAVDAHVGKAIVENCLVNGPLAKKTRVLVTHALHVLHRMDYIYVMDSGEIKEHGTYDSLMQNGHLFPRLIDEYGSKEEGKKFGAKEATHTSAAGDLTTLQAANEKQLVAVLMQVEERNTGAVTWTVYRRYLVYAGSAMWAFIVAAILISDQGSSVMSSIFLGWWTSQTIKDFTQGQYMAVYAGISGATAVFSFLLSLCFTIIGLISSLGLFKAALGRVLKAPMSFFDTTPMGRIVSRLSKDQDTLDGELPMMAMQFAISFCSVLGTVTLVFYGTSKSAFSPCSVLIRISVFPYLGILFVPLTVLYLLASIYYRRTSVETKRMDSLLRSALYASYSETLTGLATIRAYGEQARAIKDADHGLDMENRAKYMTISIQRWLGIRLDLFGNILVLGIALFAAGFRYTVDPSKIGVVLSYTLGVTFLLTEMVNQFAQIEQSMNAVERILHYTDLPSEAAAVTKQDPPPSWPDKGEIQFTNVKMQYREKLPLVLDGVSFHIRPGEKIGIVGRTGAGTQKLSASGTVPASHCFFRTPLTLFLIFVLLSTVELMGGKIEIDGYDISAIGLDALRRNIALVPQDNVLFLGTLRQNIDPHKTKSDAELISLLQQAWLLPHDGTKDPVAEAKFSLDVSVSDEGSNFSAGEKQLLALCRALVRDSSVIVLDEATSNVDVETDAKVQRTIRTEFKHATLLCIAHRLNTIVYYDRILVMDAGKVVEFDTVLNLFDRSDSIFRSLCEQANLSRADILRIRAENADAVPSVETLMEQMTV
ncbi:Oligomycin resistance ATP-dependent permease YOR1 [Mycena venus]|uniref:Oligomycin resistance ATP-dependent permease YOR1 n=1 Tax=Mycena venus TaxID=2733690 RepID=A0A8H6XLV2_9AGAR|nr:Oligomycin resistance ATP-dependent permease YOR1 [Mycena venus]